MFIKISPHEIHAIDVMNSYIQPSSINPLYKDGRVKKS